MTDNTPDAVAPMIALDKVDVTLTGAAGPVPILHGVSLQIDAGESVAIVGPSGSGKSTMMMVIAGLERTTGGDISVANQRLTAMDEDQLARFRRDNIGIVFQNFHLVPTMTALENVAVPLEFAGRTDAFQRARDALTTVGLDHRLNHYPSQLSGGEQQRVAMARAAAVEPKVLLADEPTGNLDSDTGERVIALLFELQKTLGTTLLLITHDAQLASRCDRAIALRDGALVTPDLTMGTG